MLLKRVVKPNPPINIEVVLDEDILLTWEIDTLDSIPYFIIDKSIDSTFNNFSSFNVIITSDN